MWGCFVYRVSIVLGINIRNLSTLLHCEASLIEGYVRTINEEYDEALSILSQAHEQIKGIIPPSKYDKSATTLESNNSRDEYNMLAFKANELAFTKETSAIVKQIDSLKTPQVEHRERLKELQAFLDEYERRSFFAENLPDLRADIEYALVKLEKIVNQKEIKSTLEKAGKKQKQIDDEVEKLESQLKGLEKEEAAKDTLEVKGDKEE